MIISSNGCIEDDNHVDISSHKLPIHVGDNITLTWSTVSLTKPLQDIIAPSDLLVDIKLHIFQISNDVHTLEQVTTLDSNVANTGSATVTVPTISHSSNHAAVISIEVKGSDLIETTDQSFTLKGRMIEVNTSSGRVGEATVFSACVAKEKSSSTAQFELDNISSLIAFVDGERISFDELKSQEFDNVTVTDSSNKTLMLFFQVVPSFKSKNKMVFYQFYLLVSQRGLRIKLKD